MRKIIKIMIALRLLLKEALANEAEDLELIIRAREVVPGETKRMRVKDTGLEGNQASFRLAPHVSFLLRPAVSGDGSMATALALAAKGLAITR